jgi:glycerol kinase
LQCGIVKPETSEITALGAAYLAGLGIGMWDDVEQIKRQWNVKTKYEPDGDFHVKENVGQWHRAINTTSYWSNNK